MITDLKNNKQRASERDGCARRDDARRFFSRGDRALFRRETRRARKETASIASSTMPMKFKNRTTTDD